MPKLRTLARKYGAKLSLAAAVASTASLALAEDPVSASAALTQLQTDNSGFGPVMFGLALVATGIMVGVKWIKRGKAAA